MIFFSFLGKFVILEFFLKPLLFFDLRDASRVVGSSYDFSMVDSNSLSFLFEHAPKVAKELNMGSELSFKATEDSPRQT